MGDSASRISPCAEAGQTIMVRPQFIAARFSRAGATPIVACAVLLAVASIAAVALVSDEAATATNQVKERSTDPTLVDEVGQLLGMETEDSVAVHKKKHAAAKKPAKKKAVAKKAKKKAAAAAKKKKKPAKKKVAKHASKKAAKKAKKKGKKAKKAKKK